MNQPVAFRRDAQPSVNADDYGKVAINLPIDPRPNDLWVAAFDDRATAFTDDLHGVRLSQPRVTEGREAITVTIDVDLVPEFLRELTGVLAEVNEDYKQRLEIQRREGMARVSKESQVRELVETWLRDNA